MNNKHTWYQIAICTFYKLDFFGKPESERCPECGPKYCFKSELKHEDKIQKEKKSMPDKKNYVNLNKEA